MINLISCSAGIQKGDTSSNNYKKYEKIPDIWKHLIEHC